MKNLKRTAILILVLFTITTPMCAQAKEKSKAEIKKLEAKQNILCAG